MPVADEALWTIADVARFLQVTEKTVYRLAQSGRIPAFKLGWVWRFREAEIREWVEEQRQPRTTKRAKRPTGRRSK